jgi:hypothetical protein
MKGLVQKAKKANVRALFEPHSHAKPGGTFAEGAPVAGLFC